MRIFVHRILPFLLITLFIAVGQTPLAASSARGSTTKDASVILGVTPTNAPVGSVVTLHITYNGIGEVNTTITAMPSDVLSFDPPRSMPCKFDQDLTGCTEITFRAVVPGKVTIHTSTNGEIHDSDCNCWLFVTISEDVPAVVTVTGNSILFPMVRL